MSTFCVCVAANEGVQRANDVGLASRVSDALLTYDAPAPAVALER